VSPSSIQPYDIFMILVIAGATAFGFRKGMAWQLASLASLILSAVVAVRFYPLLPLEFSSDPQWNRYIVMLILYLGTSLGIWMAFRLVSGIIDRVKLQGFDRQAGGMFGLAKGILWCLVITFFAVTLSEWARQAILKTYSGHYIAVLLEKGTPLLPDDVRGVLGKYIQELEGKLATDGPPSPNLSPESAVPEVLSGRLAPGATPGAAPSPGPAPLLRMATPWAPAGPSDGQPPASQPPWSTPPSATQTPTAPPPVVPRQPPPLLDYPDEPVPKGMQRVE
jgi:membrane protein required for colicin V production